MLLPDRGHYSRFSSFFQSSDKTELNRREKEVSDRLMGDMPVGRLFHSGRLCING
jgi:hypothetical protein